MGKQCRSWSVEEEQAIVLAVSSAHQSVAEVAQQRGVYCPKKVFRRLTGYSGHLVS